MTIEELDFLAIEASMAGDMEALESALAAREEAIRSLLALPASEEVFRRIQGAIIAGESIKAGLEIFRSSRGVDVVG